MSDENSKFNVLAIGVIGVVAGYLIGKNFGSKISTEVKRVTDNPEELKKDIVNFRENSGEMLADVKGKMADMLGQLEEKLKAVDAILGDNDGKKGSK
jgi:hypothetical protein